MRRKCSSQEGELDSLKKLLYQLRTSSPEEVGKLVLAIRSYEDPIAALNSYYNSTEATHETNGTSDLQSDLQLGFESELYLIPGVSVQADALPTTVASSSHVSHLMSEYLTLERPVQLPPINYQELATEINKGDTASENYCSDLLVNAICAHQCFLSYEYTESSVTRQNLGRKFLDECYRLLRLKIKGGRITLPTAQAMTLIYQAELIDHVFDLTSGM
ncbi:hypothetical protein E4U50_003401 [Claviceps purpurea]|nr:hypothetical protein E4U50_003401 [Claviceps purpurea]